MNGLSKDGIKHQKLVHEYINPNFIAIIEFESLGDKTLSGRVRVIAEWTSVSPLFTNAMLALVESS
ncbi:hypothetical protein [Segetibacter koreensis]|uniref:hypothetical protein n=1 Tax=Segetibacter koreensis TaxID=398037 RepID=UPI0003713E79|nr:hypothetical protein [Segetibacter koreensis]